MRDDHPTPEEVHQSGSPPGLTQEEWRRGQVRAPHLARLGARKAQDAFRLVRSLQTQEGFEIAISNHSLSAPAENVNFERTEMRTTIESSWDNARLRTKTRS